MRDPTDALPERLWRLWARLSWQALRPTVCALLSHKWCDWDDRGDGKWYRVCDRCCELQEQWQSARGEGQ